MPRYIAKKCYFQFSFAYSMYNILSFTFILCLSKGKVYFPFDHAFCYRSLNIYSKK